MEKRFSFTVDFDDDCIFDESIKQAISQKCKKMAETYINDAIEEKIKIVIEKELSRDYAFDRVVKRSVASGVTHKINSEEFKQYLDYFFDNNKDAIIGKARDVVCKKADKEMNKRISTAIHEALYKQ